MQKQGLLPGRDNEASITECYDVANNVLVESKANALKDRANGLKVLPFDNADEIIFPQSLINQAIEHNKEQQRYPWLQTSTEIRNLEQATAKLIWKNIIKKIRVKNDAQIFIDNAEDDIILNKLLIEGNSFAKSDYDTFINGEENPKDVDAEYSALYYSTEIAEHMSAMIQHEKISIINSEFWSDRFSTNANANTNKKTWNVFILFNSLKFDITYNDNNAIVVKLPREMPYPNAVALNNSANVFAANFSLHNGSSYIRCKLGYSKVPKTVPIDINEELMKIVNQYMVQDYKVLPLLVLLDEEDELGRGISEVVSQITSIEEKFSTIESIVSLSNKLSAKKINVDNILAETIKNDVLSQYEYGSFDDVATAVDSICNFKLYDINDNILKQGFARICENIGYVNTHIELLKIFNHLYRHKESQ